MSLPAFFSIALSQYSIIPLQSCTYFEFIAPWRRRRKMSKVSIGRALRDCHTSCRLQTHNLWQETCSTPFVPAAPVFIQVH